MSSRLGGMATRPAKPSARARHWKWYRVVLADGGKARAQRLGQTAQRLKGGEKIAPDHSEQKGSSRITIGLIWIFHKKDTTLRVNLAWNLIVKIFVENWPISKCIVNDMELGRLGWRSIKADRQGNFATRAHHAAPVRLRYRISRVPCSHIG